MTSMWVVSPKEDSTTSSYISITGNMDGSFTTYAPSPPDNAVGNQIATASFVHNKIGASSVSTSETISNPGSAKWTPSTNYLVVPETGTYLVHYWGSVSMGTTNARALIASSVNPTDTLSGTNSNYYVGGTGTGNRDLQGSAIYGLNKDDHVHVTTYVNATGTFNFTGARVRITRLR